MTEVMQVREAYRVEQWRQLMQRRRESPLNNREFCAHQGISEKSYYYWLKKLLSFVPAVPLLSTYFCLSPGPGQSPAIPPRAAGRPA